jgi:hypothetical protein
MTNPPQAEQTFVLTIDAQDIAGPITSTARTPTRCWNSPARTNHAVALPSAKAATAVSSLPWTRSQPRGVREDNPREQRVPRRSARGVGNQCVRRPRGLPGNAAAPSPVVGRTHRQCVERSRIADGQRGPGLPLSRVLRPGVPRVQGGSQRDHVGHDDRVGDDRDQSQPGHPGIHKDAPLGSHSPPSISLWKVRLTKGLP